MTKEEHVKIGTKALKKVGIPLFILHQESIMPFLYLRFIWL